jgi:hypothetical protein
MGNIFEVVQSLCSANEKNNRKLKQRLEGKDYVVCAQTVGDKAYRHQSDGKVTEACVLEALDERPDWASAMVSFIDSAGVKKSITVTAASDSESEHEQKREVNYPSAVFTASGALVELAKC